MLAFKLMEDGTYAMLRDGIAVILGLTLIQAQEAATTIGNCVFQQPGDRPRHR